MKKLFFLLCITLAVGLVLASCQMNPFTAPKDATSEYTVKKVKPTLNPNSIPQFVDPLPTLDIIAAGVDPIELHMTEFQTQVLSTGTFGAGVVTKTWVWGYLKLGQTTRTTYLGPVIVATRDVPTELKWVNNLGNTASSKMLAWVNSTDQTLHWADPLNFEANTGAKSVIPGMPPTSPWNLNYSGSIPAVVHLHGGEVPPVLDGGPDAWFLSQTSNSQGAKHGHAFYSKDGDTTGNYAIYRYPNSQEAAPIWFHDHLLGGTRLSVYAGLAGAYLITDPNLTLPAGLDPIGLKSNPNDPNTLEPIVPLVIQDRMFDAAGQLYFPNVGINPEHPYWVPEFLGDVIVVNGKTWPFLNVQPKRYRFLFVNGSNARPYELFLLNRVTGAKGPAMWVIGTDGGYLDAPVKIDPNVKPNDKLIIMPGERYDVIIDFSGAAGQTLQMRNTAKAPYPAGAPPSGGTTGRIIQFNVSAAPFVDNSYNPATLTPLRTPMVRLANPLTGTLGTGVTASKTRQLTLNEVIGAGGPLEILVNNTKWSGESLRNDPTTPNAYQDFTAITVNGVTSYISELPNEGETEVWEIVNLTADAHPIHLHLTQFQLVNRQAFNLKAYNAAYAAAFPGGIDPMTGLTVLPGVYMPGFGPPLNYNNPNTIGALGGNPDITPYLMGLATPPLQSEAGWKDTVIMYPGQVTRIVVRFAPMNKPVGDLALFYPFDPNILNHGYVWHCHIIDHEDNEMMRPYNVLPKSGAVRTYIQGVDY